MSDIASETNVNREDNPRSIPEFASEEEAQEFWATHDSTDYWDQMEDVTATPSPQVGTGPDRAGSRARKRPSEGRMDLVSIRIPSEMIEAVKEIAAQRHLPYQTLMRSWIGERLVRQREEMMQPPQSEKALQTKHRSTKPERDSEAIEALIAQLNRDSETIMRGRIFTEDSADSLREMREERTAAQSAR